MLKAAREDRAAAKEAYLFFKQLVEDQEGVDPDLDARRSMLECLKVMQSAQQTAIRALDTFVKAEDKLSKDKKSTKDANEPPTWKDLNSLELK